MTSLPLPEQILLVAVLLFYIAAAIFGWLQIRPNGKSYSRIITHLFSVAIVLEVVIMVFRAAAIQAIPLTGTFESMIVLTVIFGMTYLLMGIAFEQVWFSSVMSWVLLGMILITAFVATPASQVQEVAMTPWTYAHALMMILAEVMILFATISAIVYLIADHHLKQKKIFKVIGIVPNMEKLQSMNHYGVIYAFILVTLGLLSGFGMAYLRSTNLGVEFVDWFGDPKVVTVFVVWGMIAAILYIKRFTRLSRKVRFYLIMATLVLTIIGELCPSTSKHDFKQEPQSQAASIKIIQE